jgi:hypothetical protein
MAQGQYFGVESESIRVDFRVGGEHASCYGVNLAFAGLGMVFSQNGAGTVLWGGIRVDSR